MALVRKAGGEGDFRQGIIGRRHASTGEFDPQLAELVSDAAAESMAEHARQVGRMDSRGMQSSSE